MKKLLSKEYSGMKKHHWVYFFLLLWLLVSLFSGGTNFQNALADESWCTDLSAIQGKTTISGHTYEWDYNVTDSYIITEVWNAVSQNTGSVNSYTLYVNGVDCGHPEYGVKGTFKSLSYAYPLIWDDLDIVVENDIIVFEIYCTYTSSYNWLYKSDDVDCDGNQSFVDHNGWSVDGQVSYNGTIWALDELYYFVYTNYTSADTNVYTIKSDVSYFNVELTGYFNIGIGAGYDFLVGFEVNETSDFTNNITVYSSSLLDDSSFFNAYFSEFDSETTYYYRAIAINSSSGEFFNGSTLNFTTTISSGCVTYDSSYINIGTGFSYSYESYYTKPVIEFQSKYNFNGTLQGLELYVPYDYSDELSHWHLYIDGVYIGSADCTFAYGNGYKMQFNYINTIINDEYPIFDIYKDNGYPKIFQNTYSMGPPNFWACIYAGETSIINDITDGTQFLNIAQYMLYITTNETTTTDCSLSNNLNIVNIFPNATGDYNLETYKTIFFSATVNSTASPQHKLAVYKNDVIQYLQDYPKSMTKCSGIYGFTPITTGSYYAVLTDGGTPIVGTYEYFNVTATTKDYAIYTYPNPCAFGEEITVNTYVNDTGTFQCLLFDYVQNTILYNYSVLNNPITNGSYSFTINTGILTQNNYYYFRIFKQVGSIWSAVGDYYTQYIYGVETNSYISLSQHAIETGDTTLIYGYNYELLTRVAVFENTVLIYDNLPNGYFGYDRTYNTKGTYQIYLKKYVNNAWVTIDSDQLTVSEQEGETTPFLPNIGGTTLGWIIGFCIILAFSLAPIGISAGFHVDVPIMVYVLFAGIGMAFSIAIGYIAWWIAFFIIALLVCIIIIEYLRGSGAGSGT